ncbi:MAG: histidine ammonia-lyase [Phycisphaerales bacterium]
MPITLDGAAVQVRELVDVARRGTPVALGPDAAARVRVGREALEAAIATGETFYGVNTGFGSLSTKRIGGDDLAALQANLIRSHAAGVGAPLPTDVVRGMLLLLIASLGRGRSGVRVELVEALVAMLNAGVTPVVPETGSVGASGDLAPLAHAAQVLMGEGRAELNGVVMPGGEALANAGLAPFELAAKEGLALINGTHLMASRLALVWDDFERLFSAAVTAAAMSIDACRGTDAYLDERVYTARNQPGAAHVARLIRDRMAESEILASHRSGDPRVQDPYSFRCAPIVLGSVRDAGVYIRERLESELGAVTDNPLVFADGDGPAEIVSAGNFHGMPAALPLDVTAIALSHLAGISERRVYHMLSVFDPETNLNPFLSPQPGLHSGLMIAQYTAAAACNELVGLANPASVANISTSAGMEDYNSFGPRAAAKASRGLELARSVVAIELLCAAQAMESHRPLKTGARLERAHATIRSRVAPLTVDRSPTPDIEAIAALIDEGAFDDA